MPTKAAPWYRHTVRTMDQKAEYFSQHAKPGMVFITSERCAHQSCTSRPSCRISSVFCPGHANEGMAPAPSDSQPPGERGASARREGGGEAEGIDTDPPRAAPHRKRPVVLGGVPASDSAGGSSKERVRPANVVPVVGVSVNREEGGRLTGEASGPSLSPCPPQPTGGVLLPPTPPIGPVAEGGVAAW